MEYENRKVSLKDIVEVIKFIPKIIKLVWEINIKYFIIVTILSIVNGLIPVISLLASQNLINSIQMNLNKNFNFIMIAFVWFILVNIIENIVSSIHEYYSDVYRSLLEYRLNEKIMEKAKYLSLINFETPEVYNIISRAESEAGFRPYALVTSILTLITSIITLISAIVIISSWSWIAIVALLIIPIVSIRNYMKIGYLNYTIHRERTEKERKAWYYKFISTHDREIKEIKLYNLEDHFLRKYQKIVKELFNQNKYISKKRVGIALIFSSLTDGMSYIITFFILRAAFLGGILLGNVIGLIQGIELFKQNSQNIALTIFAMYNNVLFSKLLFEYFEMELYHGTEEIHEIDSIETIEFKNVYFKYMNKDDFAIKNISFYIKRGEKIALVGENGSGKTTIVKLITRLYEPTSGNIYINGINIMKISKTSLRKEVGVVFQDFNKYEMTLKENIEISNLEYENDYNKLKEACELADIKTLVDSFKKGVESQLGLWFEDGTQLSGGQWQKIAVARAFYREASLYILDEPSSALDPKAENSMFNNFFDITYGKTTLFITHKVINTNFASRIFVLQQGELVENGTREELLNKKNTYYEMYILQNKEVAI